MNTKENIMEETLFDTIKSFEGIRKFKSIGRAYRRGHLTSLGVVVPKRHYHNKKNTCKRKGHHSRSFNEFKKQMYAEYLFRERYHHRRV